jgi:spermidine synthase
MLPMNSPAPTIRKPPPRDLLAVALISVAVLGLEVALMRSLSISRWHHFAYLVISLALLGFGASGTWLALRPDGQRGNLARWNRPLTLALALGITLCYRLADALPIQMQYLLYSGQQILYLLAYQLLLFLPFLLAGLLIGGTLVRFAASAPLVYGANLVGSGAGPILALLLMFPLSPPRLIQGAALLTWASSFLWSPPPPKKPGPRRQNILAFVLGLLLVGDLLLPSPLHIDPQKMLSQLRRWEAQGDARHLLTRQGPRGRLDVFASPRLHYTLFAGLTANSPPPSQALLLVDGDSAGPIFSIQDAAEAPILDHTLMSVAYRLLPRARVLLLGEASGVNIWLARRFGARQITAVQNDPQIIDLFRGPLASLSGSVFSGPDLQVSATAPRHFLERSRDDFDLIQIVAAEGMAAGVSGLLSLHEEYLLTAEGMARCLERLSPGGVVSITRGIQSPPRDNIKILATLAAALERVGVEKPEAHLAQVRNHLALCTLASRTPFTAKEQRELIRISNTLWLDIDLLPGFDPTSRPPFNQLITPPGIKGSLYHYAAAEIFSPRREGFFRSYAYNVRPATDDRPYFFDFFRWRSLPRLMEAYGPHWFQRLELGYAILVISLCQIVVVAVPVLLVPLLLRTRGPGTRAGGRSALAYFLLLGVGYLALEMTLMQRCTLLLGDPILAAAGVLSAFLLFSGCGSLLGRRWFGSPLPALAAAAGAIALCAPLLLPVSGWLLAPVASWSTAGRFLVTLVLVAPVAFFMGWPFPIGLLLLERRSPSLIPWAWGINGFASVAAAPLAVLLSMSFGFRVVLVAAVGCYALTYVLALRFARN